MFTVIETPLFQKQWPLYWTEEERGEFAGELVLLTLYAKASTDNLSASVLKEIARAIQDQTPDRG